MFINVFGNKPKAIVRPERINKTSLSESVVEIIDNSFNVGFPKIDGLGLNPWIENSLIICPGARIDKQKQDIFVNLLSLTRNGHGNHHT